MSHLPSKIKTPGSNLADAWRELGMKKDNRLGNIMRASDCSHGWMPGVSPTPVAFTVVLANK